MIEGPRVPRASRLTTRPICCNRGPSEANAQAPSRPASSPSENSAMTERVGGAPALSARSTSRSAATPRRYPPLLAPGDGVVMGHQQRRRPRFDAGHYGDDVSYRPGVDAGGSRTAHRRTLLTDASTPSALRWFSMLSSARRLPADPSGRGSLAIERRTSIALPEAKCSGGADDGTADGARTTMTTTTANIAASATKRRTRVLGIKVIALIMRTCCRWKGVSQGRWRRTDPPHRGMPD